MTEDDAKRVVAYSSLSHLGLILIAIFSFDPIALGGRGGLHHRARFVQRELFLVLGYVEAREETRSLARLGGLAPTIRGSSGALMITALAALGFARVCRVLPARC